MKKKKGLYWIFVNSVKFGEDKIKRKVSVDIASIILIPKTNENTKNSDNLEEFFKTIEFLSKNNFILLILIIIIILNII